MKAVTVADDIEHLKTKRIDPELIRREQGKVSLGVVGQRPESERVDEFSAGSGEVSEEVPNAELEERIVEALKTVYDPEIPLNLYDLGLIYGVEIDDEKNVEIEMTLTAPGCPVAGTLVREVAEKVGGVSGVRTSHVKLTWSPPWTKDRMTDEAKLELGLL